MVKLDLKKIRIEIIGGEMEEKKLFRLALVTSAEAPQTLKKYIALLAKLCMVENDKRIFTDYEIVNLINENYKIEFSKTEVQNALKNDKAFIINDKSNAITLSVSALSDLKKIESKITPFEELINLFFDTHPNICTEELKSKGQELIQRYIYHSFNEGNKALSGLLHNGNTQISEDFRASNEEKLIINKFLNWNNDEKNKQVFEIVSFCLDYGMITSNTEIISDYCSFFKDTTFFIDTNIIIRLMGINNNERKKITENFIEKCLKCGIKIKYTNFTYAEVLGVIEYMVNYAESINDGNTQPLTIEDISGIGDYDNIDIYSIYYYWCKSQGNSHKNYEAYKIYLIDLLNTILNQFVSEQVISAGADGDYGLLYKLARNLKEYKDNRNPNRLVSFDNSKTDVENFLFVSDLVKEKQIGVNYYIISADRRFYDWSIKTLPGVPLVFLPSEWLSIILKFTTRTSEDYITFSNLMNLRINSEGPSKAIINTRIQTLKLITSDSEIRSRIIRDACTHNKYLVKNEDWITTEISNYKRVIEEIIEEKNEAVTDNLLLKTKKEFDEIMTSFKADNLKETEIAREKSKELARFEIVGNAIIRKYNMFRSVKNFINRKTVFGIISICFTLLLIKFGVFDFLYALFEKNGLNKIDILEKIIWGISFVASLIIVKLAKIIIEKFSIKVFAEKNIAKMIYKKYKYNTGFELIENNITTDLIKETVDKVNDNISNRADLMIVNDSLL